MQEMQFIFKAKIVYILPYYAHILLINQRKEKENIETTR